MTKWTNEETTFLSEKFIETSGGALSQEMTHRFKRYFSRNAIIGKAHRLGIRKGPLIPKVKKAKVARPVRKQMRENPNQRLNTTNKNWGAVGKKPYVLKSKIGGLYLHASGEKLTTEKKVGIWRGREEQSKKMISKWNGPELIAVRAIK